MNPMPSEPLSAIHQENHSMGPVYRPEVDGLRALAVIPVVLFHAGFEWFSGGYVGVDVFFVISGYLITLIIINEQSQFRFSIVGFYERRARRILPALFLVILTCLPFAWWWMTPHHLKSFAQSIVATILFAPNVYFFLKSGYFEADADEKPLLHTWSLGVEEQYYIGFPWLVIGFWRFGPKVLGGVIAAMLLGSLVASELASRAYPLANFYLAPTRAWELALGSLVAIWSFYYYKFNALQQPKIHEGSRNVLAILGIAMICVPMFFYDKTTRFPGINTIPPTMGAALVILFAQSNTWVGRFLSLRWIVGIGLISYSIYLWHQPLFAFARQYSTGKPSPWFFAVFAALSIVCAYGTWRFVEKPFRDRQRFTRHQIFALSFGGSMFFCAVGLTGHYQEGLPGRLKPEVRQILNFGDQPETHTNGYPKSECFLSSGQGATAMGHCVDFETATGESVFLWGDSHAAQLYSGLSLALAGAGKFTYLTYGSCAPLIRIDRKSNNPCSEFNEVVVARIIRERPGRLIIAAVWGNYDWTQLASTLQVLKDAGITRIQVVGPVPRWNPSLPVVMARFGVGFAKVPVRTLLGLDPSTPLLDAKMQHFCLERGIDYISPYLLLCNAEGCMTRVGDNVDSMMQFDVSHLTKKGSEFLVPRFHALKEG
ncbi:MAG: acyltransferase family protein [Undibacterium sp.]|uniref:acyltransferase family protein n=1 Tax=Undibacterium sp. TaxID=1914977 RepID=UPI002722E02A|nr:acyltransferase family protein [Undibacterium sp.]MDO8651354.1 acyltransferase family protein [Undibacterium sp.]